MEMFHLDFEEPLFELEKKIEELEAASSDKDVDLTDEIEDIREKLTSEQSRIFNSLTPWQCVQVARHPQRPTSMDYLSLICDDVVELHGDKNFRDDKAIFTGLVQINKEPVLLVCHRKGKDTKEKIECNFGMAHPEGYRKAMKKMWLAEKYNIPVVCLIDTPGAYPGIGAEERGQAMAIAENLRDMARLKTPVVCVIISEGGSGGALGIGIGDKVSIMENSYYSVITPEGCASILFRDGKKAPEAANKLHLTPKALKKLGLIDDIIPEPAGGAHRNHEEAGKLLKDYLVKQIKKIKKQKINKLLDSRYERFRKIGFFHEASNEELAKIRELKLGKVEETEKVPTEEKASPETAESAKADKVIK